MAITEIQRAERINYIGSSDAAAVLGLSRWNTPLQIWAVKTKQVTPEDISNKLSIEVGVELEDLCAKLFEKRTGKKTHRVNETIYHPNFPFIAANLDRRVVGEDALLECKTAGGWAAKDWERDELPQEVIIQVMHQLMVTGKAYGYACVLIGGNQQFLWRRVDRDPALIADMRRRMSDFWTKYVEPKIMPAIITKNDGEILYDLFPDGDDGDPIFLDDTANALIEGYEAMKQDLINIKGQADKLANEIKALLKDKTYGVTDKYKVSWKAQVARRLDTDAIKEKEPKIYQEYSKVSKSRVLRIKEIKGDK